VATFGLLTSLFSAPRPLHAQSPDLTVHFRPGAGTFVGRETVALSVAARANIHFTLDGSLPTIASPIYTRPLALDTSTRLRAVAIVPGSARGTGENGSRRGPVATETYLRVSQEARSFISHLPVVLIHTFESGPLDAFAADHVPATLQVMEPRAGRTRLVGRAALDARIGIHVRGETSRNFPKKQYAIELRGDADDTDNARPLLGLPAHSDWVLSDPVTYDRSLIRNALGYALSNRIGRYAPRTRFAEAFLVDDNGDVRPANYLGFFTLIEKIDRGPSRVDVGRLSASATGGNSITGGFIVRIDKGPPDFAAAGRWLQFVYPSADAMRRPERSAQLGFIRTFIDGFGLAASAPTFRHPSSGQHYSDFIDVDAWIDHHIVNALTKNVDGMRFSSYFYKDRGGKLMAGPVWDFDRSLGTPYDIRATEPEEWYSTLRSASTYFNEGWWRLLFRDPDFRDRYRARVTTLLTREFSADTISRMVDELAAQVGDAAERNFSRWPESPPQGSHATEVALLKDFVRRRVAWIRTQVEGGLAP